MASTVRDNGDIGQVFEAYVSGFVAWAGAQGLPDARVTPTFFVVSDSVRPQKRATSAAASSALSSADPPRNFTLTTAERIRALTIGVPAWAARKRKIEDDEERYATDLVELYDKLVDQGKSVMEVELSMNAAASALDLTKINKMISDHNRYYPIEANLPMHHSGAYLVYGKVWLPEEPMTPLRLLARAHGMIAARRDEGDEAESAQ